MGDLCIAVDRRRRRVSGTGGPAETAGGAGSDRMPDCGAAVRRNQDLGGARGPGNRRGGRVWSGPALQEDVRDIQEALARLDRRAAYLASSRPTAVNLFWALDRIRNQGKAFAAAHPTAPVGDLRRIVFNEACAIFEEDVQTCRRIGENGSPLIQDGCGVLTHCNAVLACAGQGTALSVLFECTGEANDSRSTPMRRDRCCKGPGSPRGNCRRPGSRPWSSATIWPRGS